MKRVAGFSLLEILAALALLALLLLGVYSGIRTATHSVHAGSAAVERLDQMRSAQEYLHRELAEATALPWSLDAQRNPVVFSGGAHEMHFVAPMPGYLGRLGPQLQILKIVDDDNGGSRLEASFAMLPPDGGAPKAVGDPEVLLTGIRGGHFSYVARDDNYDLGTWQDDWSDPSRLPAFVRIDLDTPAGMATWPLLDVAVRQSADAVNVREAALPLLSEKRQ